MALFILRRLIQSLFVLLAVSVVVFFAVYAVGDPIELLVSPEASQAAREAMIARLGLDLPVWQQYTGFLWRALHGDLGTSFVHGIPAIELIVQRIPATFELVIVAIGLTCVIGIPLGLVTGPYTLKSYVKGSAIELARNDAFSDVLGLPTVWVPHSYPACCQHGPDEHLLASVAREGAAVMAGLFWDLGEQGAAVAAQRARLTAT